MRSVADDLRILELERIRALPPADRISRALALGDDDLALYSRVQGVDRRAALRTLRATRRRGRRPSHVADPDA